MKPRLSAAMGFSFSIAALLAACAPEPPPVVLFDPQFAFPVDGAAGFYAYTTPLPRTNPETIAVHIAPVDFFAPLVTGNYGKPPTEVYRKSDAVVVDPLFLAANLHRAEVHSAPAEYAALGFFAISVKAYPKPGLNQRRKGHRQHESGVAFLDIDDAELDQIRMVVDRVRHEAARYGADAVINLRIHRNDWNTTTGVGILPNNHLIAQAEVVAIPD